LPLIRVVHGPADFIDGPITDRHAPSIATVSAERGKVNLRDLDGYAAGSFGALSETAPTTARFDRVP
jgi:hypothetical protein